MIVGLQDTNNGSIPGLDEGFRGIVTLRGVEAAPDRSVYGPQLALASPRRPNEEEGAPGGRAPPRRNDPGRYGVGSGKEPPNMSELPKVAGQSCCGAGLGGTMVPFCTAACAAARHASTAGQSAALRTSFHTAAP
jgi:hypothetical protein